MKFISIRSSNLLATRTGIKSQWRSNFSWIGLLASQLSATERQTILIGRFGYAETGFDFSSSFSSFNRSTKGLLAFRIRVSALFVYFSEHLHVYALQK